MPNDLPTEPVPQTVANNQSLPTCYTITCPIDSVHHRITVADVEYEWYGGFGAILKSWERGVKRGEIRMIGSIPFYAYQVYKRGWGKPEIFWTIPSQFLTMEWIHQFKRALLF